MRNRARWENEYRLIRAGVFKGGTPFPRLPIRRIRTFLLLNSIILYIHAILHS